MAPRGSKLTSKASSLKTRGIARKGLKSPKKQRKGDVWSLRNADNKYREHRLRKDKNIKCVFPNCPITDPKKLTLSHYHGRAKKGTRYHDDNNDWLCRNHHYWDKKVGWEFQKQRKEDPRAPWDGRYTLFMYEKLGVEGFNALDALAESGIKKNAAIKAFMETYQSLLCK
jgi:hypothetical protein